MWRLGTADLAGVRFRWGLGPMAQRKKQLIAEGKLDKHGRPNAETPKEYLRALPDAAAAPAAAAAAAIPEVHS